MCGISGTINIEQQLSVDNIMHRGPDSHGYYSWGNVQLGHTRLSILDLSQDGHQPMTSIDEDVVIVFNGEIYNHLEIRETLIDLGYIFKSTTDTETILYAYIEWGKDVFLKLNGIFSLGILDKKKNLFLLVRDRFGVKPLYYYYASGVLAFSSELKGIDLSIIAKPENDYLSLNSYIRFLWSPGDKTPLTQIKKLLPGTYLEIDLNESKDPIEPVKWFHSHYNGEYLNISEDQIVDQLEQKLLTALRRQLLSDVPIAYFLSGGLDSSLLVAMARKIMPDKKIQCFTINTDDAGKGNDGFTSDLHYAQLVAKHLNVELEIVESKSDIVYSFDKMIWHLDEPQADPAPLQVDIISSKARKMGYKVLIGGTAGDDIFSGYRRHIAYRSMKKLEKFPIKGLSRLLFLLVGIKGSFSRRLKKILSVTKEGKENRIFVLFEWLSFQKTKTLFLKKHKTRMTEQERFSYFKSKLDEIPFEKDALNQQLHLETTTFLVDHNLNYTDKMGMANGVEIRVPYLDNDLVEFAQSIPPQLKLKNNTTKYILKKVAERYLPKEVIYRPKAGFGAPVREWITNDLSEMVNTELSKKKLEHTDLFDHSEVSKLIDHNKQGKVDASYSIWSLLAIQSWHKQFMKK